MILDRTYFWANLQLTYAESSRQIGEGLSAVVGVGSKQIEIERYISKYEPKALRTILGRRLADLFIAWYNAQVPEETPIEETEEPNEEVIVPIEEVAAEETEEEEVDYCSEYVLTDEDFQFIQAALYNETDKISPIANYVFLEVERNNINTKTVRASVVEKVGKSTNVSNSTQMILVYNEFVELANEVVYKITENEHFCKYYCDLRVFRKSNRFWI